MPNLTATITATAGANIRLVASESPSLTNPVYSATVSVEQDFMFARATVKGLDFDTEYYLAVEVDGQVDTDFVGRFRTPEQGAHNFTFATASCNSSASTELVWDRIRERAESGEVEFFVHTGDYGYSNITQNDEALFHFAFTENIRAQRQAEAFRSMPWYYIWDDHDYGDNDVGGESPAREAAIRAFKRRVPIGDFATTDFDEGVYYSFVRGRVRFIVSDCRSERTERGKFPATDERQIVFSEKQLDWFKSEVQKAKADNHVVCWVNSMIWIDSAGNAKDSWGGYAAQRQSIVDFLSSESMLGRIFIVSGDMHAHAYDDGSSANNIGGIPTIQSAAIDRDGSPKGGPYLIGPITESGQPISQYSVVTVNDQGGAINVTVDGYRVDRATGTENSVIDYSFELTY